MSLGKPTPAEVADFNTRRNAEAHKQGAEEPVPVTGMAQYIDSSQMDAPNKRGVTYQVVVFEYDASKATDASTLLQSGVKELLAPMTKTETRAIEHRGMKGVAGSFIDPRALATRAEFQMFVVGNKQYTVSTFETGGADADHAARKAFFDSFDVVKK